MPQSPDDHIRILLCTRNGMPWLAAQLDSLLSQTHANWSLWVSDDGSTDDTLACLAAFQAAHPDRLERIITGPQQGAAANFLHLLCHPDLPAGPVALCDQDDIWYPEKLDWALKALGPSSLPAVWAARYRVVDRDLAQSRPSPLWPRPPSLGNALVQNILSGHTLTLNAAAAALLRRAGPVTVPHHDWWIYLVMAATGGRILSDPRLVLDYRQHGANTMGARQTTRRARLRGLFDGTMQGWITRNLQALAQADLPLTPAARDLVTAWEGATWATLRRHHIHRQSRRETAALYLAALSRRL